MNTKHQTILLYSTVDDDYDYETDDEEEEEDNVDGCMTLSRSLRQFSLDLSSLRSLKTAEVEGWVTCEICSRDNTSSETLDQKIFPRKLFFTWNHSRSRWTPPAQYTRKESLSDPRVLLVHLQCLYCKIWWPVKDMDSIIESNKFILY